MGRVAHSVARLTMGWTVRGSNPGGARFSVRPDRPWGPPSLLYNGYRVFPGVKSGRGVTPTPHPLLMPWSWKGRAIPLPTFCTTSRPATGTLYLSIIYPYICICHSFLFIYCVCVPTGPIPKYLLYL